MDAGLSLAGLLCALLPCAASPALSGDASADTLVLSLEEAEARALENHPLLEQPRVDVELSRAEAEEASGRRILPEFSLRNVWGPVPRQRGEFNEFGVLTSPDSVKEITDLRWFTDVQVQALQPLYGFGKAGARLEAAESQVDLREAELATTEADVILQVRELYWGLVLAHELEDVAQDVLGRVAEADSTLEERFEEGEITQNEMFKFEIFRYEAHRRNRELQARAAEARAGLRAALGLPEGTPYRPAVTALEPVEVELDSLETYLDAAVRNRPELSQLRAGIAARRSLVEAEERDRWPTLFAAAEFRINRAPSRFDPENPFWRDETNFTRGGLLLGFEWEMNFLQHRNEAQVSRLEARRLEAQEGPLQERIRQEVRSAYLQARRARGDVEAGEEALQASENWLRAELQTYDMGLGDVEELIDAFRANAEMRTEQLENIAAFNNAVAELSRQVGRDMIR